jgi:3-methyladenine DNA glycosylase AlkD
MSPATKVPIEDRVRSCLDWLERHATRRTRDAMARYGLPSDHALGVSMKDIQALAKTLSRDHALAAELWKTGVYEARMLTSFVDEPARVTAAQMDRWCRDFDNWGICDTLCFNLFDRTSDAWSRVAAWSGRSDEFVRRAAFALLWSLSVHDKAAGDAPFLDGLARIERAAGDERHFVSKAVNMALRAVGKRNAALHAAAVATARRLAGSPSASARRVGKEALRELTGASVMRRIAAAGRRRKGAVR